MKKILLLLPVLFLAGCSDYIQVPSAHLAKISTPSGLSEEIVQPGKIRLSNLCFACDDLIMAEAGDHAFKEEMRVFIPDDKLNLVAEVRGVATISSDADNINYLFSKVSKREKLSDRVSLIPAEQVYKTYVQPVIRETVRSLLAEHRIMDLMSNRDAVSENISVEVRRRLEQSPMTIVRMGLADVQPPEIIVHAQEAAKEREVAIQRAEADKQVKLKEAEAAYEVAVQQQQVDLKEAETQVLVNTKLAEGVNDAFVTQRMLKLQASYIEALRTSKNRIVLMPTDAMQNPGVMFGVAQSMLKEEQKETVARQ